MPRRSEQTAIAGADCLRWHTARSYSNQGACWQKNGQMTPSRPPSTWSHLTWHYSGMWLELTWNDFRSSDKLEWYTIFAQLHHFSRRLYNNDMRFIRCHTFQSYRLQAFTAYNRCLCRLLHWWMHVLYVIISQVIGRFFRIKLLPDVAPFMCIDKRWGSFFSNQGQEIVPPSQGQEHCMKLDNPYTLIGIPVYMWLLKDVTNCSICPTHP